IKVAHVRKRRLVVQIKVILLYVLAVIAFAIVQPEQALFQNRVFAVPQRQREAKNLAIVGNAGETVLAPTISARARVLVRKIIPSVAVATVVLAHRAPLPFAQVRA